MRTDSSTAIDDDSEHDDKVQKNNRGALSQAYVVHSIKSQVQLLIIQLSKYMYNILLVSFILYYCEQIIHPYRCCYSCHTSFVIKFN